jgi:hypothetical protein
MPKWEIIVDGDTPDEAIAWLKAEVAMKLQPGEARSPWQAHGKGAPSLVLGSVREVREASPVPCGKE